MIYTPLTKRALRLCYDAHAGQVDKCGLPYVFHPFHLAEQMETEEQVCVALLHDVMEDTSIDANEIRSLGMPESVMEALELLTHDPKVPYLDYVEHLSHNSLARAVKIADLRHNSDLTRLGKVTKTDRARAKKYARALELLGAS